MAIQNENNSSGLIDVQQESAKNFAAIEAVLTSNPGMSSFFGGSAGGGGNAPSQSSEIEHFMTAGISGGGKKAEIVKQMGEIAFDSGSNKTGSMFVGGKRGNNSFNIGYAGEKGAGAKGPQKPQATHLVDPGYFAKRKQAKTVDKNHTIAANVNAAGKSVAGRSDAMPGSSHAPTIQKPTPEMVAQLSHLCNGLLMDRDTLHGIKNGPMSRTRLIHDLQDGKEGAEQSLRTMSAGQKEEAFRNVSVSVKNDILDGVNGQPKAPAPPSSRG